MKNLKKAFRCAGCLALGGAVPSLFLFFAAALFPYPRLDTFRLRSYSLVIRDRHGAVLRVVPAAGAVKREWVPLKEIPPGVLKIFIRAEDQRFYIHPGVDPVSVLGSAFRNIRARRIVSGASTITMQLARLVSPHGPGLRGKLSEVRDAFRLEAKLTKKEILELWLNNIPFGSNIEGIASFSRARFGRPASALDDSRAALLAVIPRRPGRYDPALNPEAAFAAARSLLERAGLGLSSASLLEALEEAAGENQRTIEASRRTPFFAPHFTGRVAALPIAASLRDLTSTLDLELQNYAEGLLQRELALLSRSRVSNGAIFAIENGNGAVRIYAGSASWFDDAAAGKIDGVRTRAQPGSCLKPFLYAQALDSGFTPSTILPDLPTVFGSDEAYVPGNFNRRFNGPVRFRIALASSLNVPAVYLLERLGVRSFEDYLAGLGFNSIAETRGSHGAGLALGNAEVSLEELVRAFSAFPRGGIPAALKWIEGPKPPEETGPRMSAYAAWMIADILSDRSSRFTGFGPAPILATPFASMFKTGTANQYQHIWALGATERFTAGVWMGNFSGETVVGRTGSSIPARIVSRLLSALEEGASSAETRAAKAGIFGPAPPGTEELPVCAISGMAAGPYCTGLTREWFFPRNLPAPCSWHTSSGLFYPPEYQSYLAERFRSGNTRREGSGIIRMPVSGSVFYADPGLPPGGQALRVETAGFAPGALLYLNGALEGGVNHAGVYALPLYRGKHTLRVEDETGLAASVEFEVR